MADRCRIQVWKRDTYRRTGRTKSGFEMHYSRCRCSRRAVEDGCCRQHKKMLDAGWNLMDYVPAPPAPDAEG